MNTYLILVNFTQQGVQNIKDSPSRVDAYRRLCEESGGKMISFNLAMGRYDLVVLVELPDDVTIAKLNLATASKGNIKTETLKLYSESEYQEIIASIP